MKIYQFKLNLRITLAAALVFASLIQSASVTNPFIWADIPDISIIRVDNTYYMSSTTMHMAPGVPIMASEDMVNWKTISYCYSTLCDNNKMNLAAGENAYGKGTWASSLRYKDGTFYLLTFSSTSGNSHLFTTTNPHSGGWEETILPFWHDPSLVLDDDGRNYVLYGNGTIRCVELNENLTGVKSGGVNSVVLQNPENVAGSSFILGAEGTQVYKYNGYYYVFNICWPNGSGRTQICHRSQSITGPYEGKVVLNSNGVAQGSILEMADGNWMGYLFQDNGAVGRSPWLVPVTWENDWPVFNNGVAPSSFEMPSVSSSSGTGIVTSDDFSSPTLKLEWQFNHNPDNDNWSLTERSGFYRIKTGRTDNSFVNARNSLTQRTFGPTCSGRISLDVSGLKDGDCAGLGALQNKHGFVGVKRSGNSNNIVMMNELSEIESVPLSENVVYLRIDMDYVNRADRATFFYSLDGDDWHSIGNTLEMTYDLAHFMGYRFALFAYATKSIGGHADFDWFRVGKSFNDIITIEDGYGISVNTTGRGTVTRDPDNTAYEEGTTVTLTAQPEEGWDFIGWTGDGVDGSENPLSVTMDSDKLISALFARSADESGNYILNGDFEKDSSEWVLNVWGGGASGSIVDGQYQIEIDSTGEENHDIQLVQPGIFLQQGKTYKVSFDASAESDRTLDVNVEMAEDPWASYLPEIQQFDLTTSKKSFSFIFTMEDSTEVNGRLGFNAGASAENIFIDNVSVMVYDSGTSVLNKKKSATQPFKVKCVKSSLKIEFIAQHDKTTLFKLYTIKGDVLRIAKMQTLPGKMYSHCFDLRHLSNGFYIVQIGNIKNKYQLSKTIILNR